MELKKEIGLELPFAISTNALISKGSLIPNCLTTNQTHQAFLLGFLLSTAANDKAKSL